MHDPDETRLIELRKEMTAATDALVAAFSRRGEIALAIAQEKARLRKPQVRDLARETQVLEHVAAVNTGPFSAEAVQRLV